MRKEHRVSKVLVTGSEGFLGRVTCSILEQRGFNIRRFDLELGQNILSFSQIRDACQDVDAVIHLAGPCSALMFFENPNHSWKVAIEGTINVLRAFNRRVVFPSTCTLYGNNLVLVKETHPLPPPPNLYAASKVECERLCLLHPNAKILRIFTGYGPSEQDKGRYASPAYKFTQSVKKGERPLVYGNGTQKRDFIYETDVAEALILALETTSKEKIFNIGAGVATSFLDVIQILNELTGTRFEPIFKKPPKGYVSSIVADITKTKAELGFDPKITPKEGLEKTAHTRKLQVMTVTGEVDD